MVRIFQYEYKVGKKKGMILAKNIHDAKNKIFQFHVALTAQNWTDIKIKRVKQPHILRPEDIIGRRKK